MNTATTTSTHAASEAALPRVLVWDLPVRVFHWLMALCFFGAWISAESERWRLLHVTLGYTLGALVAFRVVWGFVGTRHARFSDFVRGPRAVGRYLSALIGRHPEHHVGHNPAGALAIVAMLALGAAIVGSGWAQYNELGGEWLEELHEIAADAMMAVVVVHVAGVLLSSWLHRENLIGAMFSGRKPASPDDGIRSAWRSVAAIMVVAVGAFWWQQWTTAPAADAASMTAPAAQHGQARAGHDKDDD